MTSTENIEKMIEALRWRPIEEAPKDGTEVLVTDGYEVFTAKYRISNVTNYKPFFATTANGEIFNMGRDWESEPQYIPATHFMPLPNPNTAEVLKVLSQYVVNDAEFGESLEAGRVLQTANELAKGDGQ